MTSEIGVTAESIDRAADRLLSAARLGRPCEPVRDLLGLDLAAAYATQDLIIRDGLGRDRSVCGWKVGLTSKAVQEQLGVAQPDFGRLFADTRIADGGRVDAGRLIQPRVEAEVAFVIGEGLAGPPTEQALRGAISEVRAALEIVDSRIRGWDISIVDTVADNASCGMFVLGECHVPSGAMDLRGVAMTMKAGDKEVSAGFGRDCLGDPLRAALWVAKTAYDRGHPIQAGDIILSGALGPMVAVESGVTYAADLVGLGRVRVSFD